MFTPRACRWSREVGQGSQAPSLLLRGSLRAPTVTRTCRLCRCAMTELRWWKAARRVGVRACFCGSVFHAVVDSHPCCPAKGQKPCVGGVGVPLGVPAVCGCDRRMDGHDRSRIRFAASRLGLSAACAVGGPRVWSRSHAAGPRAKARGPTVWRSLSGFPQLYSCRRRAMNRLQCRP